MIRLKRLIQEAELSRELTINDVKRIQSKIRAYLDSVEDDAGDNMDVEFLEMLRNALVSDIEERILIIQKMQDTASRVTVKGFRK
jgi:transcription antitermination factor NusA-like protein